MRAYSVSLTNMSFFFFLKMSIQDHRASTRMFFQDRGNFVAWQPLSVSTVLGVHVPYKLKIGTPKIFTIIVLLKISFYSAVTHPKDADRMANADRMASTDRMANS